ncbi:MULTISPECIES: GtrA family protein [unclassified Streptomyces]|uniref:GtrA family protein n=1 Tax=unclassified Streptomyces TaxID=2593676 RepID=UPI0022526B76|nr:MULTISPECIES: GtrA family protein [unclassified Streptomyces]MCX4526176.1 GtrA family protein [Streptomyces sp. NBC_01551]MCX4543259.1 GtrA family protein [Streptomyces sp. NBC_01565]
MSTPKHGSALDRVRALSREVAKFGAVGGMGVLVNLGVFNLIRATTDLQVVRASVIATVVAIATNYLGFRYFAYRDRAQSGRTRELALFVAFSVIGLVIENGVLYTATYGFGWDGKLETNAFKFIGIGVATVFRFWSYRTWVFKALPTPAAASLVVEQRDGQAEGQSGAPGGGAPSAPAARTPQPAGK